MRPYQLIDKVKSYITPTTPRTKEALDNLEAKTKKLEKQAEYAETEAQLHERAKKAKQRIKAAKSYPHINTRLIVIGTVFLGVIILIIAKGC